MQGNDRVRFCQLCQLNVYNIAGMSEDDAEDLLRRSEGRLCLRIYQRRDGTILTRNCPVGVAAIYRRMGMAACFMFVMTVGLFSMARAIAKQEPKDEYRYDSLKERARNWPVVGPVIDHFDPPVYAGMVISSSPSSGSPFGP
jgi:hypothetical protein